MQRMYGSTAKGEIRYQPKGVVGNIVRTYIIKPGHLICPNHCAFIVKLRIVSSLMLLRNSDML